MKRAFIFVIIFGIVSCASSYKCFYWKTVSVPSETPKNVIVQTTSRYDTEQVLKLSISIYNQSNENMEIKDITLTDRNNAILFPLTPEDVAYAYLGDPPLDLPPPPPRRSSKKFIVTGYIDEFPKDHYTGQFEIEEKETGGSLLRGYLAAAAYDRAIYIQNFNKTVRYVERVSFRTDKIRAHADNKGLLYFYEIPFRCPLSLEIVLKKLSSGEIVSYQYKIQPQTEKRRLK